MNIHELIEYLLELEDKVPPNTEILISNENQIEYLRKTSVTYVKDLEYIPMQNNSHEKNAIVIGPLINID